MNTPGASVFTVPEGVDWLVHRVATSDVYPDGLSTILNTWTLEDLADATLVLAAMDGAETVKEPEFVVD